MKRDKWEFEYTITELLIALEKKVAHHRERETFWKGELFQAEEKFRASATIREVEVTGGKRLEQVFDQQAASRVSECRTRVTSHGGRAWEYETWFQTLQHSERKRPTPDDRLPLDFDDIKFFGLHYTRRESAQGE